MENLNFVQAIEWLKGRPQDGGVSVVRIVCRASWDKKHIHVTIYDNLILWNGEKYVKYDPTVNDILATDWICEVTEM